jgi:hypothetical protein
MPKPLAAFPAGPTKNIIGTRARSSNNNMASAARPTWLCVPDMGNTNAVEDIDSASASHKAGSTCHPNRTSVPPINIAGTQQFRGADTEHHRAHPDQAPKAQLQPDRKQQEDDAQLGKPLDPFRIADRNPIQPGIAVRQCAQPEWAGNDADQDETDNRINLEPGEGGNNDPRCTKDGQRVTQRRGNMEFARHGFLKHGRHRLSPSEA